MWKWILGIMVALLVLGGAAVWWGVSKYRQFTAGGDTATVTIAGSPARVFASLASADSLSTWMDTSAAIRTSRRGMLTPGDTVEFEIGDERAGRAARFLWIVREVRADQLIAFELASDTLARSVATRRDSLVASSAGDSTTIVSIVASPMMDSVRRALGDTAGRTQSAVADIGSKLVLAAIRMQASADLTRLKTRIEGAAPPSPPRQ